MDMGDASIEEVERIQKLKECRRKEKLKIRGEQRLNAIREENKVHKQRSNVILQKSKKRNLQYQQHLQQLEKSISLSQKYVKEQKKKYKRNEYEVKKFLRLEKLRGKQISKEPWRPTNKPVTNTSMTSSNDIHTISSNYRAEFSPVRPNTERTFGSKIWSSKSQQRRRRPSWQPTRDVESLDPTSKEDILYDPSTARPMNAKDDAYYEHHLKIRRDQRRKQRPSTASSSSPSTPSSSSSFQSNINLTQQRRRQRPATSLGSRRAINATTSLCNGNNATFNSFSSPRFVTSAGRIKDTRLDSCRCESRLDGHDGRVELSNPIYTSYGQQQKEEEDAKLGFLESITKGEGKKEYFFVL